MTVDVLYGDCRSLLKEQPTHKFDLCLTDPPYRLQQPDKLGRQKGYGTDIPEYREWLWEVKRVVKPNGHIVVWENPTNFPELLRVGADLGLVYQDVLIWFVTNRQSPFPPVHRWDNKYDIGVWWTKEPATKWTFNFSGDMWNVFRAPYVNNGPVPGAKPYEIIRKMVDVYSNPGDWVIDPFAGTATTAKACLDLGRNCVTMEIREAELREYIERRLGQRQARII